MANKKTKGRSSEHRPTSDAKPESHYPGNKQEKRGKSRRLVLKSIVTGSAVTTAARSLPEAWTRPVTESVVLPAHAQASPPLSALSCRVEDLATGSDIPLGSNVQYDPSELPVTGGSSTTISQLVDVSSTRDSVPLELGGISTSLDPAGAGDVTLSLTTGGDFTLSSPSSEDVTPGGGGSASFSAVSGALVRSAESGTSTGNLEMRFSAPDTDDCVIQFTFTEQFF